MFKLYTCHCTPHNTNYKTKIFSLFIRTPYNIYAISFCKCHILCSAPPLLLIIVRSLKYPVKQNSVKYQHISAKPLSRLAYNAVHMILHPNPLAPHREPLAYASLDYLTVFPCGVDQHHKELSFPVLAYDIAVPDGILYRRRKPL